MDYETWDDEMAPEGDVLTPEPLERTGPVAIERTRRPSARLGLSVPGAIGGVLLIGAIAFGANLGLVASSTDDEPAKPQTAVVLDDDAEPTKKPAKPEPTATSKDETDGDKAATPTKKPEAEPTKKPEPTEKPDADEAKEDDEPEPTKKPEAEPTKKPEPKPTEKPEPKPTAKPVLELALAVKEGAILIKWSSCEVDGADHYKVVRSTDTTIKWPTTGTDVLVAAVEVGGTPKAWDEKAPAGKKAYYRVFCVNKTDSGYKVLAASEVAGIKAPEKETKPTPKPTPEAYMMWIEAAAEGNAVTLHWEACGSDGFSHYRIVRKVDGEAKVIAEIENAGTTTYVDDGLESGKTYKYVVQAKGQVEGAWVLLGTTEWVAVTID